MVQSGGDFVQEKANLIMNPKQLGRSPPTIPPSQHTALGTMSRKTKAARKVNTLDKEEKKKKRLLKKNAQEHIMRFEWVMANKNPVAWE